MKSNAGRDLTAILPSSSAAKSVIPGTNNRIVLHNVDRIYRNLCCRDWAHTMGRKSGVSVATAGRIVEPVMRRYRVGFDARSAVCAAEAGAAMRAGSRGDI
jgi:hypothetical protein